MGTAPQRAASTIDIAVAEDTTLHLVTVEDLKSEAQVVQTRRSRIMKNATLASHDLIVGNANMRINDSVELAASGAQVRTSILHVGHHRTELEHQSTLRHSVPHCTSTTTYRAIAGGEAHTTFSGTIIVNPGADKTDALQTSKILLLSDTAQASARPQLEIFADDVKCSHGASIGAIDETALFYLRSRGLSEAEARTLLTYAFASEWVESITSPLIRDALNTHIHQILSEERL
jgi:Fe-S cluster assembly protein SufD